MWEAHKTVIGGALIKYALRIKRDHEAELTKILADIHPLETQHKQNLATPVEKELLRLRKVISLLQYKAKAALQSCRKYYYELGDKDRRLLARALQNATLYQYRGLYFFFGSFPIIRFYL